MAPRADIPEGTVTVLFTDLVDSTQLNQQLGDEQARAIGRAIERLALERIEAHRGIVIKEMGDGLMAAFSSARRAVVCAREIQQDMAARNRRTPEQPVKMRIGLHTGEVIEEDGDIHGETVIIARRIESLAPAGGVLASETVHMVLGTARDELEDRGLFDLKGISVQWRLYEVNCAEPDDGAVLADVVPTPYIGREAERTRLLEMVAKVADGSGGFVFISGEAGAGKSRLAGEALDEARRRNLNVLSGVCLDMAVPPPYKPLIDHLEQVARQTSPERMREILGENAPEVATLMPALRQRYPDIAEPPSLPPEQERRYLLHGMHEFFHRASKIRPQVFLYDDLHWADESTLLLLEHLAPELAGLRILVIGTYRPTDLRPDRPFSRSLANLTRSRLAVDIALKPFSRDEVATMVAHRVGKTPPPALIDLLYAETEGNPFFAEETVRHLLETGKLFDPSGAWRTDIGVGETEVPRSVALLIGRRMEGLRPETLKVMAAAAVIGRVFSFDLLATISGASEDELFDALEDAEHRHIIAEVPGGGEARYGFEHEQYRQTLLGQFSLARRQRLHLRVAEALEAATRPGVAAPTVEIANHLELAGSASPPERTAAALMASGRTALDALAFEDALRLLERAAAHVDGVDAEAWATAVALQAKAMRGSGRVDDALRALGSALLAIPAAGPTRAAILLQRSQLLLDQFRAAETLGDLQHVLDQHRGSADRAAELDALLALARAHYVMSLDVQEYAAMARDTYQAAYDLAAELADKRSMAKALIPTVWFTDYWADYRPIGRDHAHEAVALATDVGDQDLLNDAEFAMLRMSDVNDTEGLAEDLLARLEARRDPVRLKEHCFWMMWVYWGTAHFDQCVAVCDRGIDLAAQLGSAPVQYGSIKALALSHAGRFDEVDGALRQEVTDDDHPFGQAIARLAQADHLLGVDALEQAATVGVDAFHRARALSRVWMQYWLMNVLTEVHARLVERELPVPAELTELLAEADVRPSKLTRAIVELRGGRAAAALDALEAMAPEFETERRFRELGELEVALAEAQLAVGRVDDTELTTRRAIERATATGHGAVVWKLRMLRSLALDARGDEATAADERARATAEFTTLRDRIADPALRQCFEAQPLAPR
jgi:class 3 adenylate cyclase